MHHITLFNRIACLVVLFLAPPAYSHLTDPYTTPQKTQELVESGFLGIAEIPTSVSESYAGESYRDALLWLYNNNIDQALLQLDKSLKQDEKCTQAHIMQAFIYSLCYQSKECFKRGKEAIHAAHKISHQYGKLNDAELSLKHSLDRYYSTDFSTTNAHLAFFALLRNLEQTHKKYTNQDLDISLLYPIALLHSREGNTDYKVNNEVGDILQTLSATYPNHPAILNYFLMAHANPAQTYKTDTLRKYNVIHKQEEQGVSTKRNDIIPINSSNYKLYTTYHYLHEGNWHEAELTAAELWRRTITNISSSNTKMNLTPEDVDGVCAYIFSLTQQAKYQSALTTLKELLQLIKTFAPDSQEALHKAALLIIRESRISSEITQEAIKISKDQTQPVEPNQTPSISQILIDAISSINENRYQDLRNNIKDITQKLTTEKDISKRDLILLQITKHQLLTVYNFHQGRIEKSLSIIRNAIKLEHTIQQSINWETPIRPSKEIMAEIMLKTNKPGEALIAFREVSVTHPNRPLTLIGTDVALHNMNKVSTEEETTNKLQNTLMEGDLQLDYTQLLKTYKDTKLTL